MSDFVLYQKFLGNNMYDLAYEPSAHSLSPNEASPRPGKRNSYPKAHNENSISPKMSYSFSKFNESDAQDIPIPSSPDHSKSPMDFKKGGSRSRSKKKSWYSNVFFPTYKSRSTDFKRIFKDLPDDEKLIVDYSCALQREILVHGRLYISQNYANFYANIFMWETLVSIRWKDVTSITKEKTALVIPNAIMITTASNKFFFASFGSRDKTYAVLIKIWQNAIMEQPMSTTEIWQLVHDCYGEELELSDNEDCIFQYSDNKVFPLSAENIVDVVKSENLVTTVSNSLMVNKLSDLMTTESLEKDLLSDSNINASSDSDSESFVDVKTDISCDVFKCTSPHDGRELVKITLPIHVDHLFTLLFTNSEFILDFHNSRRTTDLVQTSWVQDNKTEQKTRTVCLTLSLSQAVGPKSSQVTENQVMLPCSKPGFLYGIDIESSNSGIPYANSFCVFTHYCITRITETESSLSVYTEIRYKKSVWGLVKGFIEKSCWSGMEDYFSSLVKALNVECKGSGICGAVQEQNSLKRKVRQRQITGSGVSIKTRSPNHATFNHKGSVSDRNNMFRLGILADLWYQMPVIHWVMAVTIFLLLFVNGILCYKLYFADTMPYALDLHVMKNTPKSEADWINLLQHQESLHNFEVKKWQGMLHSTLQLLRQTEESLTQLQMSIHPTSSEELYSVLKSGNEGSEEEL